MATLGRFEISRRESIPAGASPNILTKSSTDASLESMSDQCGKGASRRDRRRTPC